MGMGGILWPNVGLAVWGSVSWSCLGVVGLLGRGWLGLLSVILRSSMVGRVGEMQEERFS